MQTNDIYNTCLDISNVLNAGDIKMCIRDRIVIDAPLQGCEQILRRTVGYLPHICLLYTSRAQALW